MGKRRTRGTTRGDGRLPADRPATAGEVRAFVKAVEEHTKPKFVRVDLTAMVNQGVLAMANEAFFWPLGFALTWDYDKVTGASSNLHVRQWEYPDGHRESIAAAADDKIMEQRRFMFLNFVRGRVLELPEDERAGALALIEKELMTR